MPIPHRAHADACPGVLATHQAADGALARVRLPGGRLSARQLRALAGCADEHGDRVLYLTSRANVQLRGLAHGAEYEVATKLTAAGLLPAPAHERVRNYLASPASGYAGGCVDVRPMVAALDDAVCARPELAALPGRFLFALDDGRGDVSEMDADVCWQAVGDTGRLVVGGVDTGVRVDPAGAVAALIRCAEEFVARRGGSWRVRELPGAVESLTAAVGSAVDTWPGDRLSVSPEHVQAAGRPPERGSGLVTLWAVPSLGELTTEQARAVAAESDELVVTPWRTVLVPDIEPADVDAVLSRFAAAGLDADRHGQPPRVTSCIGSSGCAKAHADVRARAREVLLPAGTRAHFAGCGRRCGKPSEPHTDVLATEDGYRLDGTWVPAGSLEESLRSHTATEGPT